MRIFCISPSFDCFVSSSWQVRDWTKETFMSWQIKDWQNTDDCSETAEIHLEPQTCCSDTDTLRQLCISKSSTVKSCSHLKCNGVLVYQLLCFIWCHLRITYETCWKHEQLQVRSVCSRSTDLLSLINHLSFGISAPIWSSLIYQAYVEILGWWAEFNLPARIRAWKLGRKKDFKSSSEIWGHKTSEGMWEMSCALNRLNWSKPSREVKMSTKCCLWCLPEQPFLSVEKKLYTGGLRVK